jgi:hypothetical protein
MAERRRQAGPITPDGQLPPWHQPSPEVPHGPYKPKVRQLGDIIREFQAPNGIARTPIEAEQFALGDLASARVSDRPDPDLLRWAQGLNKKRPAGPSEASVQGDRMADLVDSVTAYRDRSDNQSLKNHMRLDRMQDAKVTQAPSPELAAAAEQYRRKVAPRASEQDPSLSKEGRMRAAARQREAARAEAVYGRSVGPGDFGPLAGRKGVADSTPIEQLTPEQRQKRDYQLYQPGVPRLPGSGYQVWDQRLNDGEGGYANRAPDPHLVKGLGPNATVRDRARAMGIDVGAYPPGTEGQLEADVAAAEQNHKRRADHFNAEPIPGGGHRWVPNDATKAENERQRREQFLRNEYAKWEKYNNADRDGDGKPDVSFKDYQDAYDNGTDLSHTQRARQVADVITNQHRAHRGADINASIRERADQDNTARRLNTNVANVMFMRDLQNAKTPEDRIRVALGYHAQNPSLGLMGFATSTQEGQDQIAAMRMAQEEEAKKNQSPADKSMAALKKIDRAHPDSITALRTHHRMNNANGAASSPEVEGDYIANNGALLAQGVFNKSAAGEAVSNEEKEYLRQWTHEQGLGNSGDDYRNWAMRMGVKDIYDPHAQRLYKELTGQNATGVMDRIWDWTGPFNPLYSG